jgi:arsenate reductase (thioredoxin)
MTKLIHEEFDDPYTLAQKAKNDRGVLDIYRKVRDEIKAFVMDLPEKIK